MLRMDTEDIKQVVGYDPETGVIFWLVSRKKSQAGEEAGHIHKSGYRHIEIFGRHYAAHRLAWFLHYGVNPKHQIDHINKNKSDNRMCNLREATNGQNRSNTRSSSKHGLKGVCFKPWLKEKPWEARITKNKKVIYLGCYKTKEEAHSAYCDAARIYHGDFFSP